MPCWGLPASEGTPAPAMRAMPDGLPPSPCITIIIIIIITITITTTIIIIIIIIVVIVVTIIVIITNLLYYIPASTAQSMRTNTAWFCLGPLGACLGAVGGLFGPVEGCICCEGIIPCQALRN